MRHPIPVAAHALGIASEGWASVYFKLRASAGLNADLDETLQPACGPDLRFVPKVRMSVDSFVVFVQLILRAMGAPEEDIIIITAHSCKVTPLSWTGKAGIDPDRRRRLGGHSKPGEMVVDLYSRDLLSEPLRHLGHVLLWIRHGDFLPDNDRASRWASNPDSRVDLSVLSNASESVAKFDPAEALTAAPLHTGMVAKPKLKASKLPKGWGTAVVASKSEFDLVPVQRGSLPPDAGALPEKKAFRPAYLGGSAPQPH